MDVVTGEGTNSSCEKNMAFQSVLERGLAAGGSAKGARGASPVAKMSWWIETSMCGPRVLATTQSLLERISSKLVELSRCLAATGIFVGKALPGESYSTLGFGCENGVFQSVLENI